MKTLPGLIRHRTLLRLQLPAAMLITLLQRTPVVRLLAAVEDIVAGSPFSSVLRSVAATAASLGAMHSLAGATVLQPSVAGPANASVGTQIVPIGFTVTNTLFIGSWKIGGNLPPGLTLMAAENPSITLSGPGVLDAMMPGMSDPYDPYGNGTTSSPTTPLLRGAPTQPGSYTFTLQAFNSSGGTGAFVSNAFSYTVVVAASTAPSAPAFTTQPSSQSAVAGGAVTLSAAASGSPIFQWQHNGTAVGGATDAALTVSNLQPASTGIYSALVTNAGGTTTSTAAIVGVNTTSKVIGNGAEIAANILHANGNIFDQVLIDGPAVAVTADPGQILRTSCIDSNDDIIQIEFSGAGTVSVVIDNISGPAAPIKYNQAVNYMKGHVGIVVTGANETTNLSVFSVGRGNAVNQALFKDTVTYDGFADIAFIAISSANGKFGGLRTANTSYFATKGYTGVYAPGVQFTGPVFVGDINAFDTATPVLVLGSATDVRITGGDLEQTNGRAVQVSGITQLKFTDGSTSHYVSQATTPTQLVPAKANKGRLVDETGADVTAKIVVNPGG